MFSLVERWLGAAQALVAQQPYLALALGASMAALFLSLVVERKKPEPAGAGSPVSPPVQEKLHWAIYRGVLRLICAGVVLAFVAGSVNAMQSVLSQVERSFRHSHGRVTEANLSAVLGYSPSTGR